MKLRNLLYATMVACAFASCSNDDDPTPNPDPTPEAAEATLEVQIKTPLSSKATTVMPGEDDKINSLQLIVFDPTTENVAYVGTTAGKAGENIAVKTTVKAGSQKVLVLANSTKKISAGMSKAEVIGANKTFDTENAENGFSMNSGIFTVNIEAGKTNYVGYASEVVKSEIDAKTAVLLTSDPVKLFRNVGKVILKTVEISKNIDKNRYPNAALTLKNVYLLHAHKTTKLATEAAWGPINVTGSYLNGATDENYGKWTAYMAGKNEIYPYMQSYYAEEGAYVQSLEDASSISNGNKTFYAYENTEAKEGYRTLLVVEADFSYTVDGETTTSAGRFYPIAVGYKGSNFASIGDDFNGLRNGELAGLLRNLKYEVALGVKGPGYTTPFGPNGDEDTFLDVKVEVVDFGFVSQSEEIE